MNSVVQPSSSVTVAGIAGEVVEWSIDRDLTGSGVPDQARARSGFATGSGSVTLASVSGEPWRPTVLPGGGVQISARADVDAPASSVFSGRVDTVGAASARSPHLTLDVKDRIPARKPVSIASSLYDDSEGNQDTSTLIEQAARRLGFRVSPPPVASTILSAPLHGFIRPEVVRGEQLSGGGWNSITWAASRGRCVLALNVGVVFAPRDEPLAVGETHTITFSVTRGMDPQYRFYVVYADIQVYFGYDNGSTYVAVGGSGNVTGSFDDGLTVDEFTVEMQYERTSLGSHRCRIRRFVNGTPSSWGGWVTKPWRDYAGLVFAAASGAEFAPPLDVWGVAWVTVRIGTTGDGAYIPTARIDGSGFTTAGMMPLADDDAWALAQGVAAQVLGAAGIDEDGSFYFIGKDRLRGFKNPSKEQVGIDGLADIPWSINSDGVADRVTVTFNPLNRFGSSITHETIWEATEVIRVDAGRTFTTIVEFENLVPGSTWQFLQAQTDPVESTYSRWIAFSTAEGPSDPVSEYWISVRTEKLSAQRMRLHIQNASTRTLWIRDASGGPALYLRAAFITRPGETQQVEVGLPEDQAQTPFSHDGGTSIQSYEDATNLASWLYSVLSTPLPVLQGIQVVPNPARRIGQVITVYDPQFTGVRARALIYGISQSQSDGRYEQTLNLALLAVTIDDALSFAETLTSATTIGGLFDAVETLATSQGVATTSIQDIVDFWDPESVVIS